MSEFWESFTGLTSRGTALLVELGCVRARVRRRRAAVRSRTRRPSLPERWEPWLAHDPVRLVARSRGRPSPGCAAPGSTPAIATSTSSTSARVALRRALREAGLPDERLHFELFPGGHRGVSHRYPLSLAYLVGSLSITF